jgi:hypothetical protein
MTYTNRKHIALSEHLNHQRQQPTLQLVPRLPLDQGRHELLTRMMKRQMKALLLPWMTAVLARVSSLPKHGPNRERLRQAAIYQDHAAMQRV